MERGVRAGFSMAESGVWFEDAEKGAKGLGGDHVDSVLAFLLLTTCWMLLSSCSSCSNLLLKGEEC